MNEVKFVTAFAEKLRTVRHRDATHMPYVDWFSLYVQLLKQLPPSTRAVGSSRRHLRLVDNMLWSSLVAPSWKDVDILVDEDVVAQRLSQPHKEASSSEASSVSGASSASVSASSPPVFSEQMWFRRVRSSGGSLAWTDTQAERCATCSDGAPLCCELMTSAFLEEPLLGGQSIELWRRELRLQSEFLDATPSTHSEASFDGEKLDAESEKKRPAPSIIVLPFSALWAIKEQAFLRPSTSHTSGVRPVTLHERTARQILLQSIHQVLQLQVELADKRRAVARSVGGRALPHQLITPRLQLSVLSPSEEFDLLCALPRLKRIHHASRQSPQDTISESAAMVVAPPCLQLSTVCENLSARLTYLLFHQLTKTPSGVQWHLVAPTTSHTDMRRCAVGAFQNVPLRAQTQFQLLLRDEASGLGGGMVGRGREGVRSIHRLARQGCQDTVRRMTQREENLRQSFSQK